MSNYNAPAANKVSEYKLHILSNKEITSHNLVNVDHWQYSDSMDQDTLFIASKLFSQRSPVYLS